MTALTNYLESALIDHIYRTTVYTPPTSLHFAYFSAVADGESGSVTELPFLNGYARAAITRNGTNFGRTAQQITNSVSIAFPAPSGGDWGTATDFGIYDAPSGGNLLMYGSLDAPKTITSTSPAPEFPAGGFVMNFNMVSNYLAQTIADFLFTGGTFTKPSSLAFALYTTAPTASGGGIKVSGGSYADVSVVPSDTAFDPTSGGNGTTKNTNPIVFPSPTTPGWGNVLANAVLDQVGNLITYATFPAVTINAGDAAPTINTGAFVYTLS